MTRITFITIIFISTLFLSTEPVNGSTRKSGMTQIEKAVSSQASTGDHELPVSNSAHSQPMAPHKKVAGPSMEELPHIHRFHKERVKKVTKHPNRFWVVAKLILVLCHVGLLIMGYLHATH